jgi:predicted RNA-binding protein YlqC (UPF0109 family)
MVSERGKRATSKTKTGHGRKLKYSELVDINSIQPCPENDLIYTIDPESPENIRLEEDISKRGIVEPIVVSRDDVGIIISGHRRYAAACRAGLSQVPVRYYDIKREDNIDAFVELLVTFNRDQREKTFDEKLREEVTRHNPHEAHLTLLEERKKPRDIAESFIIEGTKTRSEISAAKQPMLETLYQVLFDNVTPMTVRQIHYQFLNDPPLKHASKPGSIYRNKTTDYKNLVDLVARARTAGLISMDDIIDETRPVKTWSAYRNSRDFISAHMQKFLNGYWRNLQQSQPDHIEILAEKNTIYSTVTQVAQEYCIPTTSLRGYSSIFPRYEMNQRYLRSGKQKLIILIVSDFDPDGEEIAQSFVRSMRDEFGTKDIHPVKVALTYDHIKRFDLVPNMEAKKSSAQYKKFFNRYGTNDVFEVEALRPEQLQMLLHEAIDSVMDLDSFNHEREQEARDAADIAAYRETIFKYIGNHRIEESN